MEIPLDPARDVTGEFTVQATFPGIFTNGDWRCGDPLTISTGLIDPVS